MKQFTIGVFGDREKAEEAIHALRDELNIPVESISYVYKNASGDIEEVTPDRLGDRPGRAAGKGAMWGGGLGALAGVAAAVGSIPVLGPLFAAGPIAAALGFTGGVAGAAATGAVTGAVAGGLIGALVSFGVEKNHAQRYAERVRAGDVLVGAYAEEGRRVVEAFEECGAKEVNIYGFAAVR